MSDWYQKTKLGNQCHSAEHCSSCKPNGDCDRCNTIDGRWWEAICDYASTCDGPCMQLVDKGLLLCDPVTQLGYCEDCVKTLKDEIRERLQ